MSAGDTLVAGLLADRAPPAREPAPPFVSLQRVIVRMLFDPAFAAQVHDEPGRALAGLELPRDLLEQLRRNDRRVWTADRLRRSRALKVLMEELKISTALALLETRRLAFLDAFFSSPPFHQAVQERRYLALAFVEYLRGHVAAGTLRRPQTEAALTIEGAMARARRRRREVMASPEASGAPATPLPGGARIVVAPGVQSVLVPQGTVALIQHVEAYLFETGLIPALALCDDAPTPEPLPEVNPGVEEAYLLEPDRMGHVELSGIPSSYHRLIEACATPRSLGELGAASVDPGGAREMVASLLEAGVLMAVPEIGGAARRS